MTVKQGGCFRGLSEAFLQEKASENLVKSQDQIFQLNVIATQYIPLENSQVMNLCRLKMEFQT